MDQTKLFIGAVILIGAFVAMWWFGWFAPVTRTFQGKLGSWRGLDAVIHVELLQSMPVATILGRLA